MARNLIEFLASRPHYADHLRPIRAEIPVELRGALVRDADHLIGDGPVVVASGFDLIFASRLRRPVVLLEHGAGQSYGDSNRHYVGGKGREKVDLYLGPSDEAVARHLAAWPRSEAIAVGSPRVDELERIAAEGPPPADVAISFHWRGDEVAPEAGTALDHFAAMLEPLARTLAALELRLLGHGHPRMMVELRPIYAELGIEVVEDFADVVRRARVYVVDNSSTLFEFAALDRPVVVLNAPAYRRDVDHGLRFWTSADVGEQVDDPEELVGAVLRALVDPEDRARVRREIVARAYRLRDGSSARLAAEAIVTLRRCPVCGARHASCGKTSSDLPVDENMREATMTKGPLKRYPNPERSGAFLLLNDVEAKRLGLEGQGTERTPITPPAPDPTNEGGAPLVSSTTAATSSKPKGALEPGGPTHRARARAAAEASGEAAQEPGDAEEAPRPARRRRAAPKDV